MTGVEVKTFCYISGRSENCRSVDLYFGNHSNEQSPLLVFIHGGAWRTEDKSDYKQLCEDFVKAGHTVASVNYRLSLKENGQAPTVKHPDHINDVLECLQFLTTSPIQGKYDPRRFYLVGHSAGAHIATMLLLENSIRTVIQGVLGVSGIYDIPLLLSTFPSYLDFIEQGFGSKPSYKEDSPAYKEFTALKNIPIIIAQSREDTLVDDAQSIVMYDHLKKFHSHVTLDFDIKGDHYEVMNFNTLNRLVTAMIQ